jgi:hypothetical protein
MTPTSASTGTGATQDRDSSPFALMLIARRNGSGLSPFKDPT